MEMPNTGDDNLNLLLKTLQHSIDNSHWLTDTQKTCCLMKLYDIVEIAENTKGDYK